MLVNIFKFTLAFTLLSLLAFLVIKRDLYITLQSKFLTKKTTEQIEKVDKTENTEITEQSPQNVITLAPLTTAPSIESVLSRSGSSTPQQATTTLAPVKVTVQSIPKKEGGVYEHLEEGISDTDPTYKPSVSPCTKPMGFKIGTFDSRFGLTKTQFIKEIEQSGEVWGEAIDKKLFYYDEKGSLTINLIYDSRQAITEDVNYLALEIENSKQNAEALRMSYEQEKVLYDKDSTQLTKDIANFQLRYDAYTSKVASYNASGGAQKIEYEAMMSELANLKQESKILEERRLALIYYVESINKKVSRYNEFVTYVNSLIRKSNALGANKFTEGRFTPYTNVIDIYQYNDSIKLRRLLIHELGHVLGINHTKNIQSIMYSFNSATTTMLSKEDLTELKKVCSF